MPRRSDFSHKNRAFKRINAAMRHNQRAIVTCQRAFSNSAALPELPAAALPNALIENGLPSDCKCGGSPQGLPSKRRSRNAGGPLRIGVFVGVTSG
jgi:hypothetical protein